MNNKLRVVIYVRVSTDVQAEEGFSLDAQIDRCKAYAASQDWEVVFIYVEEGESAKNLDRTEIKRMLNDASQRMFDILLVYRLDRLTRSVRDLHKLLDLFETYNIKFRSATEVYDTTTAMGKLFITIVAALAEWERQNLGERVRFGKEQQVKEGKWPGGVVAYGYEWNGEEMNIVPEEYVILRELRRLYMSGFGLRKIARHLNALKKVRRDGVEWNAGVVGYTLENPIYAGKIRYGTKNDQGKYVVRKREDRVKNLMLTDSNIPLIFTWEEYEEHMKLMKKKEKYGTSRNMAYWFTGIIRCARCGYAMKGDSYTNRRKDGTKYDPVTIYKCVGKEKGNNCNMPTLRQVVAEQIIMEHVSNIVLSQTEILEAADKLKEEFIDQTNEIDKLHKELSTIQERRKKWQYMFAEDLMNENDFRERKREEDEKEKVIINAIDELKTSAVGVTSGTMSYLIDLNEIWSGLLDEERRELMQTVFDNIYFDCDVETGHKAHRGMPLPWRITEINYN